jgi:outer membrane lipoprotein carrier protein
MSFLVRYLHECAGRCVNINVSPIRLIAVLLTASAAFAGDAQLDALLKAVEARYNKAKTLQVSFKEEYTPRGRPRRTDSGLLMLRKPGKMRWDYSQPKGKQFVSDGKWVWLYTPDDNRAEKMKFQTTDDLKAPLAFLLGKLNFDKEFKNIRSQPDPAGTRILAEPKAETLPYSAVEFVVAADAHIREVKVTSFDKSILVFTFDQERMDPPLDNKLFEFQLPKGAELVEGQQ